jgi:autotransporter adhesin
VQSLAAGANSTAVGVQSLALGDNSVALGVMSGATGVNSTALGNLSRASGSNSTAVGIQSMAAGDNTLAIGNVSFATESNSVAIGTGSRATRSDAIAVGNQAAAGGPGAIAIGAGASANAPNSVAIGSGSVAIAPNTVSVGSPDLQRRITNVAPGLAATDAVNVQQWQDGLSATTKQANQISNKVDVMNSRLTSMAADVDGRIDAVNREARRGIAAAMALAAAPMPSAPGRTTVAVNAGYYHGEAGFGVGISHRFNATVPLVLSGSYANGGGNEHVGRVGMALEF